MGNAAIRKGSIAMLAAVMLTGCGYNTIQRYDEQAAQAQHDIEVQLQRRSDLIGNLVMRLMSPPDEHIGLVECLLRNTLFGIVQCCGANGKFRIFP